MMLSNILVFPFVTLILLVGYALTSSYGKTAASTVTSGGAFVPPYLGSKGWIAIRLDLDEVDWDTVAELARRAYQDIAPRKLAALVE